MASGRSGRGAYWLGAFVGLLLSGALAAGLSIMTPLHGSEPEVAKVGTPAATNHAPVSPATEAEGGAPEQEVADPQSASVPEAELSAPKAEVAAKPAPESAPAAVEVEPDAAMATADMDKTLVSASLAPEQSAAEPAPSVSQNATPPASPPAAEPKAVEPAPGPAGFAENRVAYDGDLTQPMLAIVLSGVEEPGLESVLNLTGPVAVVLAPGAASPATLAAALHEAGFEVLSPLGADAPSDAGPVIGIAVDESAPDAAALIEVAAGGGLAFLDLSAEGGSPAYRTARGRGLPSAPAGRRIDMIPKSDMVYQSLERAAFDARRTGAFVAVGEATPAVMAGLRRWLSVKAGKSVALAPLSTVIDKIGRQ